MKILRCFILAIVVSLAHQARADLLVYKLTTKNTVIGEGARFGFKEFGFWVTDWDTAEVQTIRAYYVLGEGFFEIEDPTSSLREYQVITSSSSRSVSSSTYTTRYDEFTAPGQFEEIQTFMKGRDTYLSISPWRQVLYPKSFSGTMKSMDFRDDAVYATEGKIKLLLDRDLTTAGNINGVTLSEMIETIAIILMEDGFEEIQAAE